MRQCSRAHCSVCGRGRYAPPPTAADYAAAYWRATAPEYKPTERTTVTRPRPATGGIIQRPGPNPYGVVRPRIPEPIKWTPATPVSAEQIKRFTDALFGIKPTPAKPGKGDKVRVTFEGYVNSINPDGTLNLATERVPFPADAKIIGTTVPTSDNGEVTVVEKAPAKPRVGDIIDGKTLAAFPWKRSTVIEQMFNGLPIATYVLTSDGKWLAVWTSGLSVGSSSPFSSFTHIEQIRIRHVG